MNISELIRIGKDFKWNYPKLYSADGSISDIITEDKVVSSKEEYIEWLYKVKRLFQKEYSNDVMSDEIDKFTSIPESYSNYVRIMSILCSIEDEPQLCYRVQRMESVPAIEINNNIDIGIKLNCITNSLKPEQLSELKDIIKSNPDDKKGFMEKLLSFGLDTTTILSNVLGTEPIWNAIKNMFS